MALKTYRGSMSSLYPGSSTKCPRIFMVLLLLKTMVVHLVDSGSAKTIPGGFNRYKEIDLGGKMANITYVDLGPRTFLLCGMMCFRLPECYLFTLDSVTSVCNIQPRLTAMFNDKPAPPTLRTYFADEIHGKVFQRSKSNLTWNGAKDDCAKMGMRLGVPHDNSYALILHYFFQVPEYWVGMYRDPNFVQPWYNMDGVATTNHFPWWGFEPNNINNVQNKMQSLEGFASDEYGLLYRFGLCEKKIPK